MNKTIRIILLILTIVTVISTASYCSAPYDTETAHIINIRKTIEGGGYILRNETIIETQSAGIFEPGVKSGARVAKGNTIGIFTKGNLDENLAKQLEDVTERINEIKQADSIAGIYASDEARIYSVMKTTSAQIRQSSIDNDLLTACEKTNQLGILVQKKNSVESTSAQDQLLISLEEEKYNIEQKIGGTQEELHSPASGYYFSSTDGLEGIYKEKDLVNLTNEDVEGFEKTLKGLNQTYTPGKIVDSYLWYLVSSIPVDDADDLTVGQDVTLSLDGSSSVPAKIIAINKDKSNYATIVVKSDRNLPGVYEKRTAQFEICTAEYTGLYVPSAAIRIKDDIPGVYVMNKSNNIEFRCVNILLEEESYYIVSDKYTPPADCPYKSLSNYDNILVNPEVTDFDKKPEKKH